MKRGALILFSLLISAGAVPAQAGIEARFRAAFTGSGLSSIHYIYELKLVSGRLEPGAVISQHLTMYDIGGLIPGSVTQPADWTSTVQSTGVDADDIARRGREDAPRYLNVTWKYTGATTIDASAGPVILGDFRFDVSTPATSGRLVYVSQTSSSTGPVALLGRVIGSAPAP